MVDSHRIAAALQRTTQKYTSERVDQRISVHFRIMNNDISEEQGRKASCCQQLAL